MYKAYKVKKKKTKNNENMLVKYIKWMHQLSRQVHQMFNSAH